MQEEAKNNLSHFQEQTDTLKEEMIDYPDLWYAGTTTLVAVANKSSTRLFI